MNIMQALAVQRLFLHCSVLRAQDGAFACCQAAKAWRFDAPLAQLVEQLTLNQWVPGSNP